MKLIQVREAAARLGVSRQTLENWGKNGTLKIHSMGKAEKAHWVDADTIEALAGTMQEVENARVMLNKELADLKEEFRKEHDLLQDLRREVMMTNKFRSSFDNKEFYRSIPAMLNELGILTDRETHIMCEVISGYYLGDIAEEHGLSRSRVSQIFFKGCKKAAEIKGIKAKLDELKSMKADMAEMKSAMRIMSQELKLQREEEQKQREMEEAEQREMEEAERIEYIKQKDEKLKVFRTDIGECGFSVRTLNCMRACNVETIGDLCKWTKSELLKYRNFGKKSLTEVIDFLESRGLGLGMDVDRIYRERILERILEEKNNGA